jgi:acyl-CoA synthetase (AMP-forming)/AMP-acid ligase II
VNLMMLLEMAAQGFGERVGVQNGDERLTYAELFALAGGAARVARQAGVERLALLDVSSCAVPVALFGSAWAGLPFVPLNYRLTDPEIEALAAQIAPALLVTQAERVASLSRLPGLRVIAREAFLERARAQAAPEDLWPMEPEQIAILLFTSGTTGAPKAAIIRHRHLVSYILGSVEFMSAAESDAALVSVPPYHIAGMSALCSSVYSGRRIVQLPSFSPEEWLRLASQEKVSYAFVVPTMLGRIADALADGRASDLPSLRAISYGGGKMPLPVIERAMHLLPGTDFTNAYGLTETSSTISVLGPDDHRAAHSSPDPAVRRRLASVGRALPSVEIEIRDDEGRRLGPGQRGEIYVRGEQVSGEYLGRGSNVLADGFFPTRDAGSMDEEGYLFIEGRADDVIVRGGENMSPGEIEDVLTLHDAVADAAVVGIPDEEWGEAVAAAVVLRQGRSASEAELQAFVKSRLRSSRTPQRIVFRSELPYSETGKLLRRVVRQELSEEAP